MKIIRRTFFILLVQLICIQSSQAQFGDLKDKILGAGSSLASKRLGIDKILKQPAAITTSFEDVNQEGSKMPDFAIKEKAQPLYLLPKGADGGFVLCAGLYEMTTKSYCLHAGTYAPSSGDGYMFAPVLGPKEEIVTAILKSAEKHPEISQHDIQILLWTIIARTKFADYNGNVKLTAIALLTPVQLGQLEGGVLGILPGNLMEKAKDKLPDDLKAIFEAENKIRQLVASGNYSYDEMEKYAILSGIAPARTDIPSGIWTLHPDGYYVRYFPSGYAATTVQVYVPKELINALNGSKIIYDATNDIACPANVGSQRLAQTNEPLNPDYSVKIKTLCLGTK
ncbi:MAG: hypothetical protein EOO20_00735 [Chryseobacterium sp.]|nr:MAG: hypothetical protein EOO20_00735 [Chryseobacterium sp.]